MKKLDITDRLSFDENPCLVIKGKEYEVNADADTMLRVLQVSNEGVTAATVAKMFDLIFPPKTREEISKMKLSFKDFQRLVMAAIDLITDTDNSGE